MKFSELVFRKIKRKGASNRYVAAHTIDKGLSVRITYSELNKVYEVNVISRDFTTRMNAYVAEKSGKASMTPYQIEQLIGLLTRLGEDALLPKDLEEGICVYQVPLLPRYKPVRPVRRIRIRNR